MTCSRHRRASGGARPWTVVALSVSLFPTLTFLAIAQAAWGGTTPIPGPVLGRFAITATGAPLVASGVISAGGGLLLTDQGAATVTGRLDNSPSAKTIAVAVEPGLTLRSLSASNGGPTFPGASAQYPGGPATSHDTTVGSTAASATAHTASATASAEPTGTGATATEDLYSSPHDDLLSAHVISETGAISIAGILTIANVVGTAAVGYDRGGHHATAAISVTSASVAGLPVSIDSTGVHALGTSALPVVGNGVPSSVASILASAGISISFLQPVRKTTGTGALADSGALIIHEKTPDLTSGVTTVSSATDITLYLGRAQATVSDAAEGPSTSIGSTSTTNSGHVATPEALVTQHNAATVTPAVQGSVPPVRDAPPFRLFGRRFGYMTAFAALGSWQLLTLGIITLATMATRQRPSRPHLCPCPSQDIS